MPCSTREITPDAPQREPCRSHTQGADDRVNETWLPRDHDVARLRSALDRSPAALLTRRRHGGMTSRVRTLLNPQRSHHFNLEDPRDQARLADSILALERSSGTVVIDKAPRMPELFPMLRVLVDQDRRPG